MERDEKASWLYWVLAVSAVLLLWMGWSGCATAPAGDMKIGLTFRELPYPWATKTINVGGINVAYVEAGRGEKTIVLVHGLGSNMLVWQKTLPVLAQRYHVVALDLPGYGRSQKANYPYSMEFQARVVDRLIDRLLLSHVTIIGHSMGGQIAMTHALLFPGKAEALVLAAPAGFEEFNPGEGNWMTDVVTKDFLKAALPETLYANLTNNFSGEVPRDAMWLFTHRVQIIDGPEFDDYCYANARSVRGMLKGPVASRMGEIRVPVLVVFGTDDKLIPNQALHGGTTREVAEKGTARMPHARLTLLPNTGHLLQLENAEAWNREVLGFVGGLPEKRTVKR
jgi:pimeloyl-ACP methyl ester carboxylesterase